MIPDELDKVVPGLYKIYWKDGGYSLTAIGMLHDGTRWVAPVNWTSDKPDGVIFTSDDKACDEIDKLEPLYQPDINTHAEIKDKNPDTIIQLSPHNNMLYAVTKSGKSLFRHNDKWHEMDNEIIPFKPRETNE